MKLKEIIAWSAATLLTTILLSYCKKKEQAKEEEEVPIAAFIVDKTEYKEGETIQFQNASQNAGSFKWTKPDGQTSNETGLSYSIDRLGYDRTLQFKLEAFSPSGLKSDYMIKNVPVKVPDGKIIVFTTNNNWTGGQVSITLDGNIYQNLPIGKSNGIPDCESSAGQTFTVHPGIHFINAGLFINGIGYHASNSFTITGDQCEKWDFMP
jgi:PKD repeat protein